MPSTTPDLYEHVRAIYNQAFELTKDERPISPADLENQSTAVVRVRGRLEAIRSACEAGLAALEPPKGKKKRG